MPRVYKQSYTKPLPKDAEVFTRDGQEFVMWKPRNGRAKTVPVTRDAKGQPRIRLESSKYMAEYRDGQGIKRQVATGCRDKVAANAVLSDLLKQAERVKSNLISADDAMAMEHQHSELTEVMQSYLEHLRAKGRSAQHISDCQRLTKRAFEECKFVELRDIAGEALERWLTKLTDQNLSPRTRNSYLQAVGGFCRWCVASGRLTSDPTKRIGKLNEAADRRKQRRSLTADELGRLLYVTRWRPLAERGREPTKVPNPKGRKTWKLKPLEVDDLPAAVERARVKLGDNPEFIADLDRLGRERALIYKTLVLTGLRRGELASLTVGSVVLDTQMPHLVLEAGNAKNQRRAELPLRSDLASELTAWVAERREQLASAGEAATGERVANALFPQAATLQAKLFDRDLAVAGIDKCDDRGRTLDVHALRHTYGTLLSAGGVAPRTAQAAMRHSTIDLTMNVYTDPRALDVAAALDSLPELPLDAPPAEESSQTSQSDIDQAPSHSALTADLTVKPDKRCKSVANSDNWVIGEDCEESRKNPEKTSVSRGFGERRRPDSNRGCRICNPMP